MRARAARGPRSSGAPTTAGRPDARRCRGRSASRRRGPRDRVRRRASAAESAGVSVTGHSLPAATAKQIGSKLHRCKSICVRWSGVPCTSVPLVTPLTRAPPAPAHAVRARTPRKAVPMSPVIAPAAPHVGGPRPHSPSSRRPARPRTAGCATRCAAVTRSPPSQPAPARRPARSSPATGSPAAATTSRSASGCAVPKTAAQARAEAARAKAAAAARAAAIKRATYVVRSGDTLSHIAARKGVSLAALLKANRLSTRSMIHVGQKLRIPGRRRAGQLRSRRRRRRSPRRTPCAAATRSAPSPRAPGPRCRRSTPSTGSAPAASSTPDSGSRCGARDPGRGRAAAGPRHYTVRSGDTLSGIAARHGATLAGLLKTNRLSARSVIHAGPEGCGSPAKTATRASSANTFAGRTYPATHRQRRQPQPRRPGQPSVPSRSQTRAMIVATARRHGVDPRLALAVGWQESGWNQRQVSVANAIGIMQVIPSSGEWASQMAGRRAQPAQHPGQHHRRRRDPAQPDPVGPQPRPGHRGLLPGPVLGAASTACMPTPRSTSPTSRPTAPGCEPGRPGPPARDGPACPRTVTEPMRPPTLCGCLPVSPSRCSGVCSTGATASCRTSPTAGWPRSTSRWTPASTVTWPSRSCATTWPRTRRSSAGSAARPAPRPGSRTPTSSSVFDQGEDDGTMFLAMEYVPGQTLREVMKRRGPAHPPRRPRHHGPGAAGARRRAPRRHHPPRRQARERHPARGRRHREGRRLRAGPGGLQRRPRTSQTGVLLGTVAYLSPEQVERGIADARSDVYAAGLILFEMLTGTKAVHRRHPDPHRLPARARLGPRAVVAGAARCRASSTRWWRWPPRATPTSGPRRRGLPRPRCASRARC